ncbi:hypothetical protein NE237_017099 [Protea cynaroides]|uniref:Patatin n=1 Tax=Protea cynaroides TaxID=273540 RepID=A0A9Q0QMI0_9MAGN|nr:hypothetical protein NE237_017099 [Protea cynaroides]
MNMKGVNCIDLINMWKLVFLCMLLILTKSPSITEGNFVGSSSDDEIITILSIDGGGVKGVIPATILVELESMLQDLDGDDVHIVDYFDMIGGSSTGAIIGGFLTTPNGNGRPLYGIRVHETLTNVVIPSFDSKLLNPIIFTSTKAKTDEYMDALLSDVIIGSSSPPLAYPPHYFNTCTSHQVCREFNLFDGAVISNNPVDTLSSSEANFANGTKANLLRLGERAQELLNQNLTSFDPSIYKFVPVPNGGTTREALQK